MRTLSSLIAILAAVSAAPSSLRVRPRVTGSDFTTAYAGEAKDIIITKDNTLNGTYHDDAIETANSTASTLAARRMPFKLVNNFSGGQVKAYITGLDTNGKVVFIRSNGKAFYPSSRGSIAPVEINDGDIAIKLPGRGKTLNVDIPIPISSGRVYFSEGNLRFFMVKIPNGDGLVQPSVTNLKDPSAETNWGFVEFTYNTNGSLYANISYVDFVGMILSMQLTTKNGSGRQLTKGLDAGAVSAICKGLAAQSQKDKRNWKAMCITKRSGALIRVLSPNDYAVIKPSDFQNYWQGYVDQVWSYYSRNTLTINTQGSAGKVACRVNGDQMSCKGDNRSYRKPTAKDIWGCDSGPFGKLGGDNAVHLAILARLCAAFHRSTLRLQGGNVQPSLPASSYYKVGPTNHYSRLVHEHEVDRKGYAFPYDDVNPNGENASGVVTSGQPDSLTVYFGAPPR
ncbi:glycoside hydrolase family 64 protein [Metarhizium rileyi]|uniref:Glycoside hydrolase family 64 protein n=1 Tax=Metarhizium rileyi (strain RCEF 4871) TaxID=1649241 RepID=A0A162K0T1_METRR|nr:glycoside hydrolase family 64 protein [Metarhizium rileyi RCEF 4871]TWU77758.1 hypothetical protein ED733_008629 [Metarhizium rileyi]